MERGTLYQIRNLINRRNVTTRPKSDVNASEDFLELVTDGYIVAAVMSYLGMSSFDDIPSSDIVSTDIWMEDEAVRTKALEEIASHITNKHVDLGVVFKDVSAVDSNISGTVFDYTNEVISLGLLFLELKDGVREGDGDRVLRVWKYLMLIFKSTGRRNYAIEALTLLTQFHFTLPPNLAQQVKWSRFVNVAGLPGHNISCDLMMEHINRFVKISIEGLGCNKSEKAIIKVGKAVGVLSRVTDSFDKEAGVPQSSGKHSTKSAKKDLWEVVNQLILCQKDIFTPTPQKHRSFKTLKTNLIKTLDEESLKEWMRERFSATLLPNCPQILSQDDESDDAFELDFECD